MALAIKWMSDGGRFPSGAISGFIVHAVYRESLQERPPLDGLELYSPSYHGAVTNPVAPGWTRKRMKSIKTERC